MASGTSSISHDKKSFYEEVNTEAIEIRQTNGFLGPVFPILVQVLPSLLDDRTEVPDSPPGVLRNACDKRGSWANNNEHSFMDRQTPATYRLKIFGKNAMARPPVMASMVYWMLRAT